MEKIVDADQDSNEPMVVVQVPFWLKLTLAPQPIRQMAYAPSSASWDTGPCWQRAGALVLADWAADFAWDHEDDSHRIPSLEEATELLGDALVDMWLGEEVMTATNLTKICWFAHHAGLGGLVEQLAMRPDSPSGHHSRKVKSVLGLGELDRHSYTLKLPGFKKHAAARAIVDVKVLPPHECLHREAAEDLTRASKLRDVGEWPPAYLDHVVYTASGGRAMPMALYMDGVPTTKHDGVLGVYVYYLHIEV